MDGMGHCLNTLVLGAGEWAHPVRLNGIIVGTHRPDSVDLKFTDSWGGHFFSLNWLK